MAPLSSSSTDGGLEPPDPADSRFPSRQPSYHEGDSPLFPYPDHSWPAWLSAGDTVTAAPVPVIPQIQPLENIATALSATPAVIPEASPATYYPTFPPLILGENGEDLASCQSTTSWPAYAASDSASIDLCQEGNTSIQRTDSTLSAELVKQRPRSSLAGFPRSKSPWKVESDRSARISVVTTPPAESGVKKSRKAHLRASSSRRNSLQVPPLAGTARIHDAIAGKLRKRSPAAREEVESNDEALSSGDEDSRHRPKTGSKERTFACPFYRRWPVRHMECMSRKLTRIQDVKQHIYRRHSRSPFYCPTCFKDFASPEPRDTHIRDGTCRPVTASSKNSADGISAQVQDSLKNRFSRKLLPEEQWYSIWELVFPDAKPPQSSYLGSMVSETVGMLRDFWKEEGQRIIPGFVRPNQDRPIAKEDLQNFMMDMLDKVEDHFDGEGHLSGYPSSDDMESQAGPSMEVERSPVDGESGASPEYEDNSYEPATSEIWGAFYSPPFDSPPTHANGALVVEPRAGFGSTPMLTEPLYNEQAWTAPAAVNPPVSNRFQ